LFHANLAKHIAIRSLNSTDSFVVMSLHRDSRRTQCHVARQFRDAHLEFRRKRQSPSCVYAFADAHRYVHLTEQAPISRRAGTTQIKRMIPTHPAKFRSPIDTHAPLFEIGDRVRLRLHPNWRGTVVTRSLSTNISVNWDNHGIETTHSGLLELMADENQGRAAEVEEAPAAG
jgi:hypothetical protein